VLTECLALCGQEATADIEYCRDVHRTFFIECACAFVAGDGGREYRWGGKPLTCFGSLGVGIAHS
jgi:hypothetical protein